MATYSSIKYDFTPPTATTSAQVGAGAMTLIKSIDASSDNTISFVDGTSSVVLDNTYKTYIFKYINVHPTGDGVNLSFQGNVAGGSGYDETITSTYFRAYHLEDDSATSLSYNANADQAQGTGFNRLSSSTGVDNDQSSSGELWLFNPSNTTFVTHFMSRTSTTGDGNESMQQYVSGYFNTTAAIDEIQFKFNSGDMGSGTFNLYGIA